MEPVPISWQGDDKTFRMSHPRIAICHSPCHRRCPQLRTEIYKLPVSNPPNRPPHPAMTIRCRSTGFCLFCCCLRTGLPSHNCVWCVMCVCGKSLKKIVMLRIRGDFPAWNFRSRWRRANYSGGIGMAT